MLKIILITQITFYSVTRTLPFETFDMPKTFKIAANIPLIFSELGLSTGNVLRRANLPADIFARKYVALTEDEYFDLWMGAEAEMGDRPIALEMSSFTSLEAFDPAIFAALCSPDLNCAAKRLSRFKQLIGPLKLDVNIGPAETTLAIGATGHRPLPNSLGILELAFFTQFTRRATRIPITQRRSLLYNSHQTSPITKPFSASE